MKPTCTAATVVFSLSKLGVTVKRFVGLNADQLTIVCTRLEDLDVPDFSTDSTLIPADADADSDVDAAADVDADADVDAAADVEAAAAADCWMAHSVFSMSP